MTKIMLVEDDKSLREIYGVRLLAEGYDIVSAGDGEEALAIAVKERPQLIISDVMMPKISGFDLLDILRSTTETKDIRVIMMTALSSEDQRLRGEQLGADRYLVKSQVGIEDVVRIVHEVLSDGLGNTTPATQDNLSATSAQAENTSQSSAVPSIDANLESKIAGSMPLPVPTVLKPAQVQPSDPHPPQAHARVLQPLNDPTKSPVDIKNLLDKELAKEAGVDFNARPEVVTTEQTKEILNDQLKDFIPLTVPGPEHGSLGTTTPQTSPETSSVEKITIAADGELNSSPPSGDLQPPLSSMPTASGISSPPQVLDRSPTPPSQPGEPITLSATPFFGSLPPVQPFSSDSVQAGVVTVPLSSDSTPATPPQNPPVADTAPSQAAPTSTPPSS
ncbi:MAG: response regulator [Candidatus Saccharimonadales bacterium]